MSAAPRAPARVVVLALGTFWGDVAPLLRVASAMARGACSATGQSEAVRVGFVTHAAHQNPLEKAARIGAVPDLASVSCRYVDVPVLWGDPSGPTADCKGATAVKRRRVDAKSGPEAEMEELFRSVRACVSALGGKEDAPLCLAFSLFALAGVHMAEALGAKAVVLHPGALPDESQAASRRLARSLLGPDSAGRERGCTRLNTQDLGLWMAPAWTEPYMRFRSSLGLAPSLREAVATGEDRGGAATKSGDKEAQTRQANAHRIPVLFGISPVMCPKPAYWPESVHVCGSWTSLHAASGSSAALAAWIHAQCERQRKVVYAGWGSGATQLQQRLSAKGCGECVDAILSAVLREGHAIVLQVPSGWRKHISRLGSEEVWVVHDCVSHSKLFPLCTCAIHHGGAGTTFTAARCGVAQIVTPEAFDQPFWARKVEQCGIGVDLGRMRVALDADMWVGALKKVLAGANKAPVKSYQQAMQEQRSKLYGVAKAGRLLLETLF